MPVTVSSQHRGGLLTVVVSGDVDLATAPEVEAAIETAIAAEGVTAVLVDLTAVGFLDSSGIGLLLRGRRLADARGVAYRVTGAHGIALQVLELTGVWTHLSGGPDHGQPTAS